MRSDILDRLQIDPGQRTVGQLLQDREAAIYEIKRLRDELELLVRAHQKEMRGMSVALKEGDDALIDSPSFRPGTMIETF